MPRLGVFIAFLITPLLILAKETVVSKLFSSSIPFIKNSGQLPDEVAFYADTFGGIVFVTEKGEIVYRLPASREKGWVIKEEFPEAVRITVKGEKRTETLVNIFRGKPKNWKRNVSTYSVISLGEIAEGVELKLKAYGNNVEKLFYVKPGADPEKIAVRVEGGKELELTEEGELVVKTDHGDIRFTKPVAYQEVDGKKKHVEVAYALLGKNAYGFKVGKYDKSRELVIDPLLASTFLGGSYNDEAYSVALDSSGNVYVAGYTESIDFPTTTGAFQTNYGSAGDAFISKFDPNLTTLIASTFFGGSAADYAYSIALDSSGNVYVAGETFSTDFPTTTGAFRTVFGGGDEAFISKFDPNLTDHVKISPPECSIGI